MLIHFCAAAATLIFLSGRTNKKIANKSRCLFLRRLSIRHKSARTDTHINVYVHVGRKNGRDDFCINLSAVILKHHFLISHLVLSLPLQPPDFATALMLRVRCPMLPLFNADLCSSVHRQIFSWFLTISKVFECISAFDLIERTHSFSREPDETIKTTI